MKTFNYNDNIIIRQEPEPYSKTGSAFRAYDRDSGIPLYMGSETLGGLIQRLKDFNK